MNIEIFEEDGDNTLALDNEDASFTIDVDSQTKSYESRMRLKDDVYYRTQKFEYKISATPIRLDIRLVERVDEPPERYCVKDGVVLESDILTERGDVMTSMTKEFIDGLKNDVEWHQDWVGDPVSMYILSKHPEIISPDDYRRYLRQMAEKIKSANLRIEKALESDKSGLQITDEYAGSGRTIWYPKSKQDTMSEEETDIAIKHKHKIAERLFDEKSKEYVGISEAEFSAGVDTLEHIEVFLNRKLVSTKKDGESVEKRLKMKGYAISLLLTLLLSWVVSWVVDVNLFLIFVIVQVITFAQAIIGGRIAKWFE